MNGFPELSQFFHLLSRLHVDLLRQRTVHKSQNCSPTSLLRAVNSSSVMAPSVYICLLRLYWCTPWLRYLFRLIFSQFRWRPHFININWPTSTRIKPESRALCTHNLYLHHNVLSEPHVWTIPSFHCTILQLLVLIYRIKWSHGRGSWGLVSLSKSLLMSFRFIIVAHAPQIPQMTWKSHKLTSFLHLTIFLVYSRSWKSWSWWGLARHTVLLTNTGSIWLSFLMVDIIKAKTLTMVSW